MSTDSLTSQQLEKMTQAVEQTMMRLQVIETLTTPPMQYNARLCWERLYDAREILRAHLPSQSCHVEDCGDFSN